MATWVRKGCEFPCCKIAREIPCSWSHGQSMCGIPIIFVVV